MVSASLSLPQEVSQSPSCGSTLHDLAMWARVDRELTMACSTCFPVDFLGIQPSKGALPLMAAPLERCTGSLR